MQYSDVQILDCRMFQSLQVEKLQEKYEKKMIFHILTNVF